MACHREEALEGFFQAYVECALWASFDDNDEPLDANYGIEDIAPKTLADMREDCRQFMEQNWDDIAIDLVRAGQDFWLTRERHGAGFWDGDWYGPVGKRLTEAAHAWGDYHLYVGDDGLIHHF